MLAALGSGVRVHLATAIEALQLLQNKLKNSEGAEQFKAAAQKLFPFSTYFHGDDVNAHHVIQIIRKEEPEDKQ